MKHNDDEEDLGCLTNLMERMTRARMRRFSSLLNCMILGVSNLRRIQSVWSRLLMNINSTPMCRQYTSWSKFKPCILLDSWVMLNFHGCLSCSDRKVLTKQEKIPSFLHHLESIVLCHWFSSSSASRCRRFMKCYTLYTWLLI